MRQHMPNDIARCTNKECPLNENCKRYQVWKNRWINNPRATFSDFKPDKNGKCSSQMKIN